MLALEDVHARRGDSTVLHGVSLEVGEGEMVALIGRNGMGKTTLLRSIIGQSPVTAGRIVFGGEDVTSDPTHRTVRRGIGVVPEGRGIFPGLKVSENLRMGLPNGNGAESRAAAICERFPILADRLADHAGSLSGGQQQILAIARALIAEPRLLLIDEFSEGIQPSIVEEIGQMLGELVAGGVSVFLVEQNARLALEISSRAYILENGTVAASGASRDLLNDSELLSQHLVV
ncbi:MAG TPA: ABC transporter ATP-binding protein [Solirubrobacterales bacterium]|nr:ABC transporter ATP-binding protein [Solirubrobacterales bacterium]HZK15410.1 ABC transporter ATP-binding protein [Solirubrobacterales bacterium]